MGFPFLTGFYSKDLILELAFSKYSSFGYFSYFLGTFGAFLTAFYSTRLLCLTFLSEPAGHKSVIPFASDVFNAITFALGVLAIPSIFIGFYSKDMIVGLGTEFFGTAIYTPLENNNIFDAEFVDLSYKLLPVKLSLLGATASFLLYSFQYKTLFVIKTSFLGKRVYNFFNRKWFFDKIYNEYFGQFFFKFGYSVSYKFVDRGIFELLGPTGLAITTIGLGASLYRNQTGYMYHYTYSILISFTALLLLKTCWSFFVFSLDYRVFFLFFISVCLLQVHKKR
jgi:NADH-ubiquinone oxidoreductase chain 5